MPEFWTMLGAVAAVVIPVALLQARNTRLLIDNAIGDASEQILTKVDKLYVRKEVCSLAMKRAQGEDHK